MQAVLPSPVLLGRRLRLLQLVDDEEVPGQGAVGRVAQATLAALVGGAVRLVLRDVFVELQKVLRGEATHGTLVNLKDVDFQLFQRLSDGSSRRPEL